MLYHTVEKFLHMLVVSLLNWPVMLKAAQYACTSYGVQRIMRFDQKSETLREWLLEKFLKGETSVSKLVINRPSRLPPGKSHVNINLEGVVSWLLRKKARVPLEKHAAKSSIS